MIIHIATKKGSAPYCNFDLKMHFYIDNGCRLDI